VNIVRTGDKFIFQTGTREKNLLLGLLKLYPCIPAAHRLKQLDRLPDSSQKLLDEALAEQRAETKKQLEAFLAEPARFEQTEHGWRFSLSRTELEWLLQILNDIRIGSWIKLGSPDEKRGMRLLDKEIAPDFWAMELAGALQMQMLEALKG